MGSGPGPIRHFCEVCWQRRGWQQRRGVQQQQADRKLEVCTAVAAAVGARVGVTAAAESGGAAGRAGANGETAASAASIRRAKRKARNAARRRAANAANTEVLLVLGHTLTLSAVSCLNHVVAVLCVMVCAGLVCAVGPLL